LVVVVVLQDQKLLAAVAFQIPAVVAVLAAIVLVEVMEVRV
jgi:hypothetical protein